MPDNRLARRLRAFREMPNDRPAKTLAVAFGVALVCAALVSSTAVLLRPLQIANQERERQRHILEIVARLPGIEEIFSAVAAPEVEAQVVELSTGSAVRAMDPAKYDQRKAARDPLQSIALAPEDDLAGIQRRAKYATVYLVRSEGEIRLIILPVHGSGYASTLYGYLALEGDANTVVAVSFFEHAETPGLGAQIDEPDWRRLWQGKKLRDEAGSLRIGVAKGRIEPGSPEAVYRVDGISGATRTSQGVNNLVRFWLGDRGFGPYLDRLRLSGGAP